MAFPEVYTCMPRWPSGRPFSFFPRRSQERRARFSPSRTHSTVCHNVGEKRTRDSSVHIRRNSWFSLSQMYNYVHYTEAAMTDCASCVIPSSG